MRALLCVLVTLAVSASDAPSALVYVVSDGYKIAPDGTVMEFGRKEPGRLKAGNAIWNGPKKLVNLAGAKNEVVAFQVVIEGPAGQVSISCDGLRGPGELPKENVSFHLVGYVKYKGAYYPDVAVPLSWKGVEPFSIPAKVPGLTAVADQKVAVVIAEVKVPESAAPGSYAGKIRITGDVTETLSLKLKVWDFALPARPSIVFDFNSYSSPIGAVGVRDNRNPYAPTSEAAVRAEHEFYRCANRHRAFLNIMPVHSQRGKPYYTPALSGSGANVKIDWTNWDKRFAPVLNGTIFDDRRPPPYFYLPNNLHWPYGYTHDRALRDQRLNFRRREYQRDHTKLIDKTPEYVAEWEAVARQYVEHFAAKGWTKTVFQVYLNHTNAANANSPWRLDEPYDRWGFRVLKYYADLTHRVFRNDRSVKVKYRLDIGHFYCRAPKMRCYKAKKYDLPLERDGGGPVLLEPSVDMWYVGTTHTFGNRRQMERVGRLDAGKEMFTYGGGQSVTNNGTMHRSLMWYMWDYKTKGFCAWNQGCRDPAAALSKPGGDHLWYSAKNIGPAGPVPSVRMKLWRRSSYDAEYLLLAEKKTSRERALAVFRKVCAYKKTHTRYRWTPLPYPVNNPEDFEVARLKLASLILGRDIAAGMKFRGAVEGPPNETVDQVTNY